MNNLDVFKVLVKNKRNTIFKVILSPNYLGKDNFNIRYNSKECLIAGIKKNIDNNFFVRTKKQIKILYPGHTIKSMEIVKFTKVTESYSFGVIFDGVNNNSFDIIGII